MKGMFSLLMLLLAAAGCSSTGPHVQWYDGPPLGTNKVALLKFHNEYGGVSLRVDNVNGERLDKRKKCWRNNTREIEFLPGNYNLSVAYSDSDGGESLSDGSIAFTADAGKVYELQAAREEVSFGKELLSELAGGRFGWTLWIYEVQTGKVIAGTPRETPLHWYEH